MSLINARSVKNKFNDLQHYLVNESPDIVCITESWLLPSCPDVLVVGECNYTLFRKDRVGTVGGGVCVLLNNDTVVGTEVKIPAKYSHLELVAVEMCTALTKVRLFVCYRPPLRDSEPLAIPYITDLCSCIDLLAIADCTTLICGDFNFPKIDWHDDTNRLYNDASCADIFCNFFHDHCLHQFVNGVTRMSANPKNADSLLDLIMCDDCNFVYDVCVSAPFSSSDHCVVNCKIILESNTYDFDDVLQYDFAKADWPSICNYLNNYDFDALFIGCSDVANTFSCFYQVLLDCISMHVPHRVVNSRRNKHLRYPPKVRKAMQRKNAAWKLYKKFRTPATLFKFKQRAAECRRLIRESIRTRENSVIDGGNIGSFFRYANKKFSFKSATGPLRDSSGSITTNPVAKANLLQSVFTSKFTADNNVCPSPDKVPGAGKLSHINFSPTSIKKAIRKMKAKAKGGPDAIPPIFYKSCCDQLCLPLSCLFQLSFHHGFLPPDWLRAYITPIFKKNGDSTDPNNYRPIALTCTMCKIMESVIKEQLLNYLLSRQLISRKQHAFIAKHSTATNLLECTHDWVVSISKHLSTDIVYVDFSRAFDSIVFSKALTKIAALGIDGKLLQWISAFLHNRQQCVVIENCFSGVAEVISGVPQGSVLGPVLFLMFINDIESVCCGDTSLPAVDRQSCSLG